jgi:hypothetical protein
MNLIGKCPGLLRLILAFRSNDLQSGFHGRLWRMSQHSRRINPDDLALIPVEYVVQRYALGGLLTLQRLQRVEIVMRHARVAA